MERPTKRIIGTNGTYKKVKKGEKRLDFFAGN
jgi:hypothetical protein